MVNPVYTAAATVTGGRSEGHGRTFDGTLEVDLRRPTEMGGEGGATNPEQLFAIGYAACFEGALGAAARSQQLDVSDVTIDSKVHLLPEGDGRLKLGVDLDVRLPSVPDTTQAVDLVRAAHQICPYSKAVRGNVDVQLTANGQPVAS